MGDSQVHYGSQRSHTKKRWIQLDTVVYIGYNWIHWIQFHLCAVWKGQTKVTQKQISGCQGPRVGGLIAKGHEENLEMKKIFYRMLVMVVTELSASVKHHQNYTYMYEFYGG